MALSAPFVRRLRRPVWAFTLALLAAPCLQAALPSRVAEAPLPSLAPMLERATPAVVNIATYASVRVSNPLLDDPFFQRFFSMPDERPLSQSAERRQRRDRGRRERLHRHQPPCHRPGG